jgi:hypothetical protein
VTAGPRATASTPSGAPAPTTATAKPVLDRLIGRGPEVQLVSVVLLFGFIALIAGLVDVSGSPDWGFDWAGALDGLLSQIPVTFPAGVLVAVATALNVLVGAILLRFLGTRPFDSLSELVVAGFAAAVVADTAALFLLGGLGCFGWPELLALQVAAVAAWLAVRRRRPLLATGLAARPRRPAAWWLVVVAIWSGPVIVQLASPAAPFFDVLPNHVAPVEHVRAFGSFATLTTSPSPIYGPSRLLLGYVGLLGELATLTGVEGVLATAAFALPLTVIMALAMRQLASRLFGASAGFWVLLTFPLTFTFMRLPDTRGTVAAFPLAAYALGAIAIQLRARDAASMLGRPDLPLAAALGGSILVHPLIGLVAAAAAAGLLILEPRRLASRVLPALVAAGLLAVPQAGTMLGIGAPSQIGFAWLVAGLLAAFLLARLVEPTGAFVFDRLHLPGAFSRPNQLGLVTLAIAGGFAVARERISTPDDPASYLFDNFLRICLATAIGAVLGLAVSRRGWVVLGTGFATGLAAWAASGLVGSADLTQQAIHYEVPKAVEYWLPVMLALGSAGAITAVWRLRRLGLARPLVLAVWLFATMYPFPGPIIQNIRIGEHRGAESLGLALREAQRGYWETFPDSRTIINPAQREVVDRLREEIEAGRLGPQTRVLHIDSSFQQWSSVPIGVFTGAIETSISLDPELSIHTEGGRLLGFDQLASQLASGYGYVVFEPARLDPSLADQITAAGYRLIWSNSVAQIYAPAA